MTDKRTTLTAAIAAIPDGAVVALGGNTLHRGPAAAVHEIVRQGKRRLEIVKTAGAYDVDLLCGAGCASAVSAGYIGFETPFGMAPSYRRSVEQGDVVAKEHACYSVIAGMRAAIQGVPFMPIAGFAGSDLPAARGFARVADPYGGGDVYVVPALTPDVAILHVHEADPAGNGRIVGSVFEDAIMARAARRVILTAERIVAGDAFAADPAATTIPGFMVDAVVEAPGGAWPLGCAGRYDYDAAYLAAYIAASRDPDALAAFIRERILEPGDGGAIVSEERIDPAVMMAVAMARLLHDGETVFHGVASPLPMVATLLAKRTHAPDLVYLNIAGGVDPAPARLPASTVDPALLNGARAMTTLADLFDLSARGRLDVAFLSGVQIDGAGRINMSVIGPFDQPKVRLPGGAGSAALMPSARRVILWRTRHDRRVFVENLDFVTAAGNVERVVTPLCVFRRIDGRLAVESLHPGVTPDDVGDATGFAVAVGPDTSVTPPPTAAELAALAAIDPAGVVRAEFT